MQIRGGWPRSETNNMSTKRIVYTRPDGGVSVVCPAPEYVARFTTEAEALDAIRAKDVPADAANVYVCDVAEVPASRRFRNCWRQVGTTPPSVSMPLARAQRMAEIRAERDERLATSDGLMLAMQDRGIPAGIAALKTYRQALRDVPQAMTLDSVATPEALAEVEPVWPTVPVP